MPNVIYSHWSDNFAYGVVPTLVSGSPNSDFPIANLTDGNPAKPWRLSSTTGRVALDLGTPRNVDIAAIIHHNLTPGLVDVIVQANTTNSWGAPPFGTTFTIPSYESDGYPVSPWVDLTSLGFRTYQFWSFAIASPNGANVAIGEVVLIGTKRQLGINVSDGATEDTERRVSRTETNLGVEFLYDHGVTRRTFDGEIDTTDAGYGAFKTWQRDARLSARPFFIVPDGSSNDIWMARHNDEEYSRQSIIVDRHIVQLSVKELSRGLPL